MTEIGLIEDNELVRTIYTRYFKTTNSYKVVFSVADIQDALNQNGLQPGIILLDVNLPSGSGIDQIKLLSRHFPHSKIVILSDVLDNKLTTLAVENGAIGYLLKSSSMTYISESLLQIANGGMPFSPATISHLIQNTQNTKTNEEPITELTRRELELVELLSDGFANKIVADKLNVTYFTVNQHLKTFIKSSTSIQSRN